MIFTLTTISSLIGMAAAHGFSSMPRARQVICKNDGGYWWPPDGSGMPNKACKNAYLESGEGLFTNAHGFAKNVLRYNDIDAVKKAIPDGTLCSAGDPHKVGMDEISPFWQKNSIVLDENGEFNIDLEFCAPAAHNPSFWDIYISSHHYSAAESKLKWGDLEKIAHFGNVSPITGKAENCNAAKYYKLEGVKHKVPLGQSDAVMYVRWQREDPAGEGFYNCIDLSFDDSETEILPDNPDCGSKSSESFSLDFS